MEARHTPALVERDLNGSVYQILKTPYGLPVTHARQNITVTIADSDVAEKLAVAPSTPLLKVVRCSPSDSIPV